MKKLILLLACVLGVNFAFAQINAVTETGDEVILYFDGTWEYLNGNDILEMDIPNNPKLFKKDDASTFLLKSNNLRIGFWLNPKKWSFKRTKEGSTEYTLQLNKSDLQAMIITERVEIPIKTLKTIVLNNAREVAPDIKIVKEEFRNVNGLEILLLQMNGTIQGIKFTYYGYYYSNESGTVQFITYTFQSLFDEYLPECEKLLNGIVVIK